jgi:hypothetical protein
LAKSFRELVNKFGLISLIFAPVNLIHHKHLAKMKIIITGSLGNISKPLTKELIQKSHLDYAEEFALEFYKNN